MRPFVLNGEVWKPVAVDPWDERLVDRTGLSRLATTDPTTHCVYLSKRLKGRELDTVLLHEIGHCALHSFGLLPVLHSMVEPDEWVAVEEWVCNYFADHYKDLLHAANTAIPRPISKCKCGGASCLI